MDKLILVILLTMISTEMNTIIVQSFSANLDTMERLSKVTTIETAKNYISHLKRVNYWSN
ncbi:MAG: hypothetical protein IPO23_08975 [Flavobacterium sp.]|nr:hypothetical protein [Flavobacterium sp.]